MQRISNGVKNQAGSFVVGKSGFRKYMSVLTTALLAVVFIVGVSLVIFNKFSKHPETEVAQTAVTDQIPGWWYQQYYGKSVCDADACRPEADSDEDDLNNAQEFYYHTDPNNPYTAGDKLDDGDLVAHGFDPSREGRMTFDQVISEDNILGESLVFNHDVNALINDLIDPNKLILPEISNEELIFTHDNSKESLINYYTETKKIFDNYFPANAGTYIDEAVKASDQEQILNWGGKMVYAAKDLRNVAVPDDFVAIHKYTISLLKILPEVINAPSQEILYDQYSNVGNAWYDKAMAAFSLHQKIDLEKTRLEKKYQDVP